MARVLDATELALGDLAMSFASNGVIHPSNSHPPYESMPIKSSLTLLFKHGDAWACGGCAHTPPHGWPPVLGPPQVFLADSHSQAQHAPAFPTSWMAKDSKVKAAPWGSPHPVMD